MVDEGGADNAACSRLRVIEATCWPTRFSVTCFVEEYREKKGLTGLMSRSDVEVVQTFLLL